MTLDIKTLASGSKGNAYIVSDGKTSLLLECGLPWRKLQEKTDHKLAREIDACLISHEHKDHSRAVKDVLKAGIDVYTSKGTAEALDIKSHRLHLLQPHTKISYGTIVNIGDLEILALEAEHDAAEPVMFLITHRKTGERLLFATDTAYIPYEIHGLTHIMIEANYQYEEMDVSEYALNSRIMRSHMSLPAVEKYLESIPLDMLKEVHLLHLSEERADAEAIKKRVQELTGAEVYIA